LRKGKGQGKKEEPPSAQAETKKSHPGRITPGTKRAPNAPLKSRTKNLKKKNSGGKRDQGSLIGHREREIL